MFPFVACFSTSFVMYANLSMLCLCLRHSVIALERWYPCNISCRRLEQFPIWSIKHYGCVLYQVQSNFHIRDFTTCLSYLFIWLVRLRMWGLRFLGIVCRILMVAMWKRKRIPKIRSYNTPKKFGVLHNYNLGKL